MSLLSADEANRIVTAEEFAQIEPYIENNKAIRCNYGTTYERGAGYNLCGDGFNHVSYATALYASICFAQDTIRENMSNYYLLLLEECSTSGGETYNYTQGADIYKTLPKCGSLGQESQVVYHLAMDDSAINLSRKLINKILQLVQNN